MVPPTSPRPVMAVTRTPLMATASAPAAHSSFTIPSRSTYWTTGGAWPEAVPVPSSTVTTTPGPVRGMRPRAAPRPSSSRRACRSWRSMAARAYTLRVGTSSWPERTRPARSWTTRRNPRAMRSTARRACHQTPLLLPDMPLAEEPLHLPEEILAVVQPRPGRDDVLALVRDHVGAHPPRARVLPEVAVQLLDLVERADPDADGRARVVRGSGGLPVPRHAGGPLPPLPLARGVREGGLAVSVRGVRGRGERDDLLAQELGRLLLHVHAAPEEDYRVPLEDLGVLLVDAGKHEDLHTPCEVLQRDEGHGRPRAGEAALDAGHEPPHHDLVAVRELRELGHGGAPLAGQERLPPAERVVGDVQAEHLLLHGQELFAGELLDRAARGRGRVGGGLPRQVEETGLASLLGPLGALRLVQRLVQGPQHLRPRDAEGVQGARLDQARDHPLVHLAGVHAAAQVRKAPEGAACLPRGDDGLDRPTPTFR